MREILRSSDGVAITALAGALEAAGIEAQVIPQAENAYIGTMSFVLWVSERAAPAEVEKVVTAFRERQPDGEIETPETRISIADDILNCKRCNYDLRGQMEDGKCPECGHPYRIVRQIACPHCAAEVPSDFAVCWRCGEEIGES